MATDLYQQDTYKELLQECEKVYHNAAAYQNSRELPASVLKQMDAFSKLKYITGSMLYLIRMSFIPIATLPII